MKSSSFSLVPDKVAYYCLWGSPYNTRCIQSTSPAPSYSQHIFIDGTSSYCRIRWLFIVHFKHREITAQWQHERRVCQLSGKRRTVREPGKLLLMDYSCFLGTKHPQMYETCVRSGVWGVRDAASLTKRLTQFELVRAVVAGLSYFLAVPPQWIERAAGADEQTWGRDEERSHNSSHKHGWKLTGANLQQGQPRRQSSCFL